MGKSHTDSRLVSVTPHMAKMWLESSMWNKQRKLRPKHVEELAECIHRDEFTEGTQIHFARLNGTVHNVNGRHTLEAIVLAKKPMELSVLTTKVNSEKQIADLYSRHDRHLARTLSDAYEAHDVAHKHGLNRGQLERISAGVTSIIGDFLPSRVRDNRSYAMRSSDERVRQVEVYAAEGKMFFDAIKGAPTDISARLRTGALIGVALLTFKLDEKKANQFWSQVAYCDGLTVGDPRKTLMMWLLAEQNKKAPNALRSRVAAHAWNSFIDGKKTVRFKTPDITAPVVLKKP